MANYGKKIEFEQQEWDMEFKDPFSLEEDETETSFSDNGIVIQPPVTSAPCFLESSLAAEYDSFVQEISLATSSSVQTVAHPRKTATTGAEQSTLKDMSHQCHFDFEEVNSRLNTTAAVSHHASEAVTSSSEEASSNSNTKLHCSEGIVTSSEEQSPIPVVLSSGKRFCASEDVPNSNAAKHTSSTHFRLPLPSAILSNSSVCFAQPAYALNAYNIPSWPAASFPLPVSNTGTALRAQPAVPYNNCVSYSNMVARSVNMPLLYSEQPISVVGRAGVPQWPGASLHLSGVVTKPPLPMVGVNCPPHPGRPAGDFPRLETVPVAHLQNGLTSHRLPMATVLPAPNRLPFSVSPNFAVLSRHCRPQGGISSLDHSGFPVASSVHVSAHQVLPHCDVVVAQQPPPLFSSATVSAPLSWVLPEHNTKRVMSSGKKFLPTEQLRCCLPDTSSSVACHGLPVTSFCPALTSSQTCSTATVSHSNPLSAQTQFARLDPRIHGGRRQNAGVSTQSVSSANTVSARCSTFVVPVPPPLPSLEELTADRSADLQKDDAATAVDLTSPSSASASALTDYAKLNMVTWC